MGTYTISVVIEEEVDEGVHSCSVGEPGVVIKIRVLGDGVK